MINILQAKSEEVKAKNRKTPDARVTRTRWAVAARQPAPLVGRGRKNAPPRTALPRKNCNFAECASPLLTNVGASHENYPVRTLILPLSPMTTTAPQLLPYLERLLDGETVEWKTLGEVCDALMLK